MAANRRVVRRDGQADPGYQPRLDLDEARDQLLYIIDGGVVLQPTLEQKLEITRDAVAVAHALGLAEPKVAVLAAAELVDPGTPSTVDAAALAKMAERGQIPGALVDGPLGLDNAVLSSAAGKKRIGGKVAGAADILIVPGVEAGNLMAKALTFLGGARMAGVVVGARVPVVIASRADPREGKLYSLALGVILASRTGVPQEHARRRVGTPRLTDEGHCPSRPGRP